MMTLDDVAYPATASTDRQASTPQSDEPRTDQSEGLKPPPEWRIRVQP